MFKYGLNPEAHATVKQMTLTLARTRPLADLPSWEALMSALGAEWRQLDPSSKARFEQMAAVPVE